MQAKPPHRRPAPAAARQPPLAWAAAGWADRRSVMTTTLAEQELGAAAAEKHDTVISIQDVHRIYQLGENRVHALRGINLEIGRGEFVAVMGSSGSGKSTLMNILGCLDRPTSGSYVLDGVNVAQLAKQELAKIRNRRLG